MSPGAAAIPDTCNSMLEATLPARAARRFPDLRTAETTRLESRAKHLGAHGWRMTRKSRDARGDVVVYVLLELIPGGIMKHDERARELCVDTVISSTIAKGRRA